MGACNKTQALLLKPFQHFFFSIPVGREYWVRETFSIPSIEITIVDVFINFIDSILKIGSFNAFANTSPDPLGPLKILKDKTKDSFFYIEDN
jgi:hypothetical protein